MPKHVLFGGTILNLANPGHCTQVQAASDQQTETKATKHALPQESDAAVMIWSFGGVQLAVATFDENHR